jgi:hypothetical protein
MNGKKGKKKKKKKKKRSDHNTNAYMYIGVKGVLLYAWMSELIMS